MWRAKKNIPYFNNGQRLSDYPRSLEDFKKLESKDLNKIKARIEKYNQSVEVYWEGQKVVVLHYTAAKLDLDQLFFQISRMLIRNQKRIGTHFILQ